MALASLRRMIRRWLDSKDSVVRSASRLQLLPLENRLTPASSSLASNTLTVNFAAAGATAENVTISNDGTNIILTGDVTGTVLTPVGTVNKIVVQDTSGGTNQGVTFAGTKAFTLSAGLSTSGVEDVTVKNQVDVTTTGAILITAPRKILLNSGLTTDTGTISLKANTQATATTGSFIGIDIQTANVSSNSGNISLQGRGGNGAGGSQIGVQIVGVVGDTTTGTVVVNGTGGPSTGSLNYGVNISAGTVSAGGGNVSVIGVGGGTGSSTSNYGVNIESAGLVLAAGAGAISIQGSGGTATSGNDNAGIVSDGTVSSSGGAVTITGTGGGTSISGSNAGIHLKSSAQFNADGTGTLTVNGTGGNGGSGNNNYGVWLEGGLLQSFNGPLNVTGLGGGAKASVSNRGVFVDSGGQITGTGTGAVTVVGTGGPSTGKTGQGVVVGDSAIVTTGGGTLSITATPGNTASEAIFLDIASTVATGGTGALTIVGDSLVADASAQIRAGDGGDANLTIRPKTAGTKIQIGGADVLSGSPLTLGLSSDEINTIFAGALQLGDASTGPISVTSDIQFFFATNITLTTASSIAFSANFDTADGNLTLASAGAVTQTAGNILVGAGNLNLQLASGQAATFPIAGNTAAQLVIPANVTATINGSFDSSGSVTVNGTLSGTGTVGTVTVANGGTVAPGAGKMSTGSITFQTGSNYSISVGGSLAVTGTVNLGSATLKTATGATPTFGQIFKIIDNDAADAVTGTFTGLVEGATVTIGGYPYRISYKGPDNNDVILSAGIPLIATGAGQGGGPHVTVRNTDGTVRFSFFAYAATVVTGMRVATGDMNNDGTADIIVAPGPGNGPHVKVFNGVNGALLNEFFAYPATMTKGVFVAVGDTNGDGKADIITGAGAGNEPRVRVYSGANLNGSPIRDFIAYPGFNIGVTVAAGDFNNDSKADIVTVPEQGNPHLKIFSGTGNILINEFFAYNPVFPVGAYVAVGDVTGDGKVDIVTGASAPGGPHLKVFNGANFTVFREFFAYAANMNGGVRVAATDINADGIADVITGNGASPILQAHMKWRDGRTDATLFEADPYGSYFGGMYVG